MCQDLSLSSHVLEHEIDLVFRDTSMKRVMYPSTDSLQLLCPDPKHPKMIMALTTHRMEHACDKMPSEACAGDLANYRMKLRHKCCRGRLW